MTRSLAPPQDEDGWTALMYASFGGHSPTVDALVKAGAKLDIKNADGHSGEPKP